MSGDRSDIEAIKARLDIVQVVQRYVRLRAAGERWSGVCPFHEETKPSFSVSSALGAYYCFGCQASGDVIDFYSRINGLEFTEALRDLAEEAGVQLRAKTGSEDASGERSQRRACYEMHAVALAFYRNELAGGRGAAARQYLQQQRGLSEEMIRQFELGYSPNAWDGLKRKLQQSGYSAEQGVTAGLLSQSKGGRIYDRFRNRIIFPIHDLSGRVVAFGGRAIGDGEPKYLNSSESPIFKKGEHLYGLYQARKSVTQGKRVLLTEGYSDVLSLVQFGFPHACGVLGTALGASQVRRLAGLCKEVTLVFDGDRAGRQAALRSAEMILQHGLSVYVVALPQGEDVDGLLRSQGAERFQRLLEEASEGLAFCLNMIRSSHVPREIMNWAVSFLSNLAERSWQAYFLPRVAAGLNISETELRQAVREKSSAAGSGGTSRRRASREPEAPSPGRLDRDFLRFALCYPEYMERLQRIGLGEALRTQRGRQLWSKLLEHGVQEVQPHLDQREKQFYIQCRFAADSRQEPEMLWEDIQSRVREIRHRKRYNELQQALSRAQSQGDMQEVYRLLQQMSQSTKGGE
jgi:DNA primase